MSEILVDVRTIPPRDRHPMIFSTFAALPVGGAMVLVNDHDPRPLFYQFQAEQPGCFDWSYLEAGPDQWRVSIAKTAEPRRDAGVSCCGTCS
ncbi:MAG: DUF2249 domain-containing protein [Actinomycetota bacterium]